MTGNRSMRAKENPAKHVDSHDTVQQYKGSKYPRHHSYILCYINVVEWFMNWSRSNTFTSAKGETAAKLAVMGHDILTERIWRGWHWWFNSTHAFLSLKKQDALQSLTGSIAAPGRLPRSDTAIKADQFMVFKKWPLCVREKEREKDKRGCWCWDSCCVSSFTVSHFMSTKQHRPGKTLFCLNLSQIFSILSDLKFTCLCANVDYWWWLDGRAEKTRVVKIDGWIYFSECRVFDFAAQSMVVQLVALTLQLMISRGQRGADRSDTETTTTSWPTWRDKCGEKQRTSH